MPHISGIFGLQGTGKTLLMTYLGIREHNKLKKPIYSNYMLKNVDFIPVNTLNDIETMRNGIALLDELWLWLFARSSMSKVNQEISKIIFLNRKRNMNIYYTSQLHRQTDVLLRECTQYFYYPNIIKNNGKKLLTYEKYNLLGSRFCYRYIPYTLEQIGSYYNTYEEIESLNPESQLEQAYHRENFCYKHLKKKKSIDRLLLLPNSGQNTGFKYDIAAWDTKGNMYLIDVKTMNPRGIQINVGSKAVKQIENAEQINAIPIIAFISNKDDYTDSSRWYLWKMDKLYLMNLKTSPGGQKLLKESYNLRFCQFPLPT